MSPYRLFCAPCAVRVRASRRQGEVRFLGSTLPMLRRRQRHLRDRSVQRGGSELQGRRSCLASARVRPVRRLVARALRRGVRFGSSCRRVGRGGVRARLPRRRGASQCRPRSKPRSPMAPTRSRTASILLPRRKTRTCAALCSRSRPSTRAALTAASPRLSPLSSRLSRWSSSGSTTARSGSSRSRARASRPPAEA